MSLFEYLAHDQLALLFSAGLLGLMVGSFLNVVIYRLPIMLKRTFCMECAEVLERPELYADQDQTFNLVVPRSRCPHCQHLIGALENIPILSFVWQGAQCKHCRAPISWRYPLVEALTALLSVAVVWQFGLTWAAGGALLLTWGLIALSGIDLDTMYLPDDITLPLLWLGLIFNLFGIYTTLPEAVIGAIAGYVILWLVFQVFLLVTGKEGMGYGDFKLLAVLGAWLGWQMLPVIILFSSLAGAIVGISMMVLHGRDKNVPFPFGPYLAAAGWLALLWGQDILTYYLHLGML